MEDVSFSHAIYHTMDSGKFVKLNPDVSVTLKQIREQQGLNTVEMAKRLGISREEYSRAENGKPPKWMKKASVFFETCFEAGYLPNQVKLSENTTHSV
jgi:DNA-binding XRE family transcriptional regulator